MPALIVSVYGRKIGTTVYSVTFLGFSIASFSAFLILKEGSKIVGLKYMFWIFTGIQLVAVILVNIIDFTVKYKKAKIFPEIVK